MAPKTSSSSSLTETRLPLQALSEDSGTARIPFLWRQQRGGQGRAGKPESHVAENSKGFEPTVGPQSTETQVLFPWIHWVYAGRFFDAMTIDGWYVQGPFLKGVEKLRRAWVRG